MVQNIIFCGDTFLRTRNGMDPFEKIRPEFLDSYVCLNLETALKGSNPKKKNVVLTICDSALSFLTDNINVLTIVNNHTADSSDPQILANTLRERGKIVVGPDNPSITNTAVGGISIDFLAAYFSLPRLALTYNGNLADNLVKYLRDSKAKRKIVNLHWGYEHTRSPAPFQRQLAHRLIDAGADLIIGHHPHVPQGQEVYNNKPIFYSLGNFNFWQFDGETKDSNRWGYMVKYNFNSGKTNIIPYCINNNYQPYIINPKKKLKLHLLIKDLNKSVLSTTNSTWTIKEYASWYKREIKVWKQECWKNSSFILFAKWMYWLLMPMQLKFYSYFVFNLFFNIFRKY